ncbi:MAG: glycerol-3-phosphate acyltransferase [Ardenticatenaceae bacterium]|nr:glycerol-3-phosphate acyltransferase [Ardenticatenaceae bacterium]MCB9445441.1 glycerol-3-phosphate acyltransferase [Ardenticatenaceae bacterium]
MNTDFLWILLSFLSGALPLSVWLGRLALGVDIRDFGDGNPGAANVWRAGGTGWGWLAILLDFFKGAIPVGLAHFVVGVDGWWLTAVALAPILGHAFSPFLRFRGGKALAVTFGIWSGLSLWLVPMVLGLLFALWFYLLKPEGWAVMAGSVCLLIVLLFLPALPVWLAVWLGMVLIFAWTHRVDLAQRPQPRWSRH